MVSAELKPQISAQCSIEEALGSLCPTAQNPNREPRFCRPCIATYQNEQPRYFFFPAQHETCQEPCHLTIVSRSDFLPPQPARGAMEAYCEKCRQHFPVSREIEDLFPGYNEKQWKEIAYEGIDLKINFLCLRSVSGRLSAVIPDSQLRAVEFAQQHIEYAAGYPSKLEDFQLAELKVDEWIDTYIAKLVDRFRKMPSDEREEAEGRILIRLSEVVGKLRDYWNRWETENRAYKNSLRTFNPKR